MFNNIVKKEKFYIIDKVELKKSEGKGLGVFAKEEIKKGTVIESSHVLVFARNILNDFMELYEFNHPLYNYVFSWEPGYCAVAFGFGSIYNHSNDNNAAWRPSHLFQKHPEPDRIHYVAIKDIQPGEEICIHYNPQVKDIFFADDGTFHRGEAVTDREIRGFKSYNL